MDGLGAGDCWPDYAGYNSEMIRWASADGSLARAEPPRQDTAGHATDYKFGSARAGMCNMAFCDGSVHHL